MEYLITHTYILAQDAPDAVTNTPDGNTPQPQQPNATDQATAQNGEANTENEPQPGFFGQYGIFILLGAVMIVFWIFMSQSSRKQKKKREEQMSSLKKNTKVQTVGGIIGVVMEIKDDEVVLKVDESSNTRMRFKRTAIAQVLEKKTSEKD